MSSFFCFGDIFFAVFFGPLPKPGSPFFFPHPHAAHILFLLSGGRGVVDKVRVRAASGLSLCFSRGLLLLA